MTLETHNKIPPFLYRLMAAKNGKALGPEEIAERSGLSRSTIHRMSSQKDWNNITHEYGSRFVNGCGFKYGCHKEINRRIRLLGEVGIAGLKHMKIPKNAPLHMHGSMGNRLKFITRIVTQ